MLWVLIRTISMRQDGSIEHLKHVLKLMGKILIAISANLFCLTGPMVPNGSTKHERETFISFAN